MNRLEVIIPNRVQTIVEKLYRNLERRIIASPPNLCPVDLAASFLKICRTQTYGRCMPCRIGLAQLEHLLEDVLDQKAVMETIDLIERTAPITVQSADYVIGYEAADVVLKGIRGSREDHVEHVVTSRCMCSLNRPIPCVALCPAGVGIPGYIALVRASKYADAVQFIRGDNPSPTTYAFVCGHPCEARCRRNMIDASINIRGIKRYAIDHVGKISAPVCVPATGKQVAVIGAGPGGLSTAYCLSLTGHSVIVYEKQSHLGRMLWYGTPSYRLPRERFWDDIEATLSTGIQVKTGVNVGRNIEISDLTGTYNVVYIAIGAHPDRRIGIPGENSHDVLSVVDMLCAIGNNVKPGFAGKTVVVIDGGNATIDAARSAMRLGAEKVTIVYRRREGDMTTLPGEVQGAANEGCRILCLQAPSRTKATEDGDVAALWACPQIISGMDSAGRPKPVNADMEERQIPCDLIVSVIGQNVEYGPFAEYGVPVSRGNIVAQSCARVDNIPNLFVGGDCVSGPTTVIKAVAAGKVAAANIDNFLGCHREITTDVVIPPANMDDRTPYDRINLTEQESDERKNDFDLMGSGITGQEAAQESLRCLRCDHFGYGVFKGERAYKW